jgi:UDP-N-acetylglucosamine 2-epimerase
MTVDDENMAASARVIGPVMCVVGARPNVMKMAPILRALAAHQPPLPALLAHTGQHHDQGMSHQLFEDLGLPRPDLNLEVGSGSHALQTAEVMHRFEPALDAHQPSCVLVVGDVNSTLACTLVAVKKGVPVVHVAAGLRSYDRKMPEEISRVLTDQVADRLYTTERSALDNLLRDATLVLTDSGGLQEATTALDVPCLTLRESTERPITAEQSTNTLVGRDADAIRRGVAEILRGEGKRGRVPELWDGRAADRIAADLWHRLKAGAP